MKTAITLREFERIGGNMSKINMGRTFVTYGDKNNGKPVEKIVFDSNNKQGDKLYNVHFKDGIVHRYAEGWITTEVEFVLSENYR